MKKLLIALVAMCTVLCSAQYSQQPTAVRIQNNGVNAGVVFGPFLTFNCVSGLTCAKSGNSLTVTVTGGGGGVWGSITGTLSSQTDLNTALGLKAPLISPSFTTPSLGVATATSINKMAITAPATSSTLAVADGKTATFNNTLTLAGTDSTTMTFPTTSATIARTDAAQTFTGIQTFSTPIALGSLASTVVNATSPGVGLCHFAGSTQTCTSSLLVNADITNATIDLSTKVIGSLPDTNLAQISTNNKIASSAIATPLGASSNQGELWAVHLMAQPGGSSSFTADTTANVVHVVQWVLPAGWRTTVTKVTFNVGTASTTAGCTLDMGEYSLDGNTKIFSTGAVSVDTTNASGGTTGAGQHEFTLGSAATLDGGTYYLAWVENGCTVAPIFGGVTWGAGSTIPAMKNFGVTTPGPAVRVGTAANAASSGVVADDSRKHHRHQYGQRLSQPANESLV
jgi:hypothetical protein